MELHAVTDSNDAILFIAAILAFGAVVLWFSPLFRGTKSNAMHQLEREIQSIERKGKPL